MSKMSLLDKLKIFIEMSKSSYLFIILIILLIGLGILFATTKKENMKRNKRIYIMFQGIIIALLLIVYHSSLITIFDYLMDNLFIAILFPNFAIYFAAIIIMNIIIWISLFNFKTSEIVKRINIAIFIIMNYLLALILSVVNTERLDVFTQSSMYNNDKATALIELSSLIFIVWILFLTVYKIILAYIRKDYKPKVKKVIVKHPVKILPENYVPTSIPDYIYGKTGKQISIMDNLLKNKNKNNQLIIEEEPIIEKKSITNHDKELTKEFEKMLTVDDYRLLLKMLKEQKEKERQEEEKRELEVEKQQLLRQKEITLERERREQQKKEVIRLEQERKEALRLEQLRLEALKEQEQMKEQEKFTELEMLYRSIR